MRTSFEQTEDRLLRPADFFQDNLVTRDSEENDLGNKEGFLWEMSRSIKKQFDHFSWCSFYYFTKKKSIVNGEKPECILQNEKQPISYIPYQRW